MATSNTKRKKDAGILNDLYETPLESLSVFFEQVPFPPNWRYLDPCSGLGQISDFLIDKDLKVVSNELFRDEYKTQSEYAEDFLTTDLFEGDKQYKPNIDCVIMNPPFNLSLEFVQKALKVAPTVYVFGRVSFLEGKKRFEQLHQHGHLKEVWLHTSRVGCRKGVMNDQGEVEWEKANNAVFYAWYVFERGNKQEPVIRWL